MTFWSELHEQPATLERLLDADGRRAAREAAAAVRRHDVRYGVIAARGTSDNAARYAQYLWGARNRLSVALATPSLFTAYASPPSLDSAVVIGVSQSGHSPDIVAVIEEARGQARPTIAVTNDPESPLASAAHVVFDLRAGPERAVAATKTYTAELAAMAMISAAVAEDEVMWSLLSRAPAQVAEILERAAPVARLAGGYAPADRCVVLGRGYHLATAFEWALKLQELCSVGAQPFSTVDFEHGPIAMVGSGDPVLAVVPPGPLGPEVATLLERLRAERGARVLAIAPKDARVRGADRLDLPSVEEWTSPIVAIVAAQLFAAHLSEARGLDPDAPRGLAKVTRTW